MIDDARVPRRLVGTVAVVTGAARGIGQAIAARLAAEGACVAALDISASRLGPAVEALAAGGADVRGHVVDVASRAAVREVFAAVERDFGAPVGALVNNAVFARFQPLADVDEETVRRTLAVGLEALVWTTQAAAAQMMRCGGGAIVNLSSVSAIQCIADSTVYAATKAGVLGLTRASAVELAPHGIRVNAIAPGMIVTPASLAQFDAATLEARERRVPGGRFGAPEEIAAVAAFLLSADSAYVNGATIVADGAWTRAAV